MQVEFFLHILLTHHLPLTCGVNPYRDFRRFLNSFITLIQSHTTRFYGLCGLNVGISTFIKVQALIFTAMHLFTPAYTLYGNTIILVHQIRCCFTQPIAVYRYGDIGESLRITFCENFGGKLRFCNVCVFQHSIVDYTAFISLAGHHHDIDNGLIPSRTTSNVHTCKPAPSFGNLDFPPRRTFNLITSKKEAIL